MASIYKAAIRGRLVSSSLCEGTRLPKKLPREVVLLATATVEALISAAPPRLRALVVLGAGTGMRQGECFGLALDRIDFLRRTLRVDQQFVLMPGTATFLAPPKTSASHRTIPLPQLVVEELAEHVRRSRRRTPTARSSPSRTGADCGGRRSPAPGARWWPWPALRPGRASTTSGTTSRRY